MKKTKKKQNKSVRTFSKKDFNSGDGMLTTAWGPAIWHYLHMMSFNYPVHPTEEDKIHYKEFILNLQYVLPCKYCRINLTKNLKHHPICMSDMKNRETFSKYVYDLHEIINKMLNKKTHLSYADVRERYEHFRSRCTQDDIINKTLKETNTKESGCTESLHGKKSKCIINIVPQEDKRDSFQMHKTCLKTKKNNKK
jgi:hypothetical protein